MTRLTEQQRSDRRLSGTDLQRQITDLATIYGWTWVHFRAARTDRGWKVPVEGPLGKGWPDLVLVSQRGRTLAIEVKRELGDAPTADQLWVHETLQRAGWRVEVWRPSDMSSGRVQSELAE